MAKKRKVEMLGQPNNICRGGGRGVDAGCEGQELVSRMMDKAGELDVVYLGGEWADRMGAMVRSECLKVVMALLSAVGEDMRKERESKGRVI